MLHEALKYVIDEARKSAEARVIKPPDEPAGIYYVQHPDGTIKLMKAAPPLAHHVALDLSAVADFAVANEQSQVWYSREKVVCVLDDADRRETVTLTLEFSPQLRELQKLERSPTPMDQRAIVYLLRTTFKRCLGRAGNLLETLRAVRFNSNAAGEGVVAHGKSSVGKRLEQEITGVNALPEYVTLEVPVFTNATLAKLFAVECALEPDAANGNFKLVPLPNEIERAVTESEFAIAQGLGALLGKDFGRMHYGKA
jgi:hypothetical protein